MKSEENTIDSIKESLIKANIKLDSCCASLTNLSGDIKVLSNNVNEIDKRCTILERDLASAFKIIDNIREKLDDGK